MRGSPHRLPEQAASGLRRELARPAPPGEHRQPKPLVTRGLTFAPRARPPPASAGADGSLPPYRTGSDERVPPHATPLSSAGTTPRRIVFSVITRATMNSRT